MPLIGNTPTNKPPAVMPVAYRREERALQVVAVDDHVPGVGLDDELASFQIREHGMDGQSFRSALAQNVESDCGRIHCCHLPSVGREIERIPAKSTGEIESSTGLAVLDRALSGAAPAGGRRLRLWHNVRSSRVASGKVTA